MEYLNYEGLKYYHQLLKDKLSKIKTEAVSESTYLPGDNITIENKEKYSKKRAKLAVKIILKEI